MDIEYKRILIKLSGEILSGERGFGIDPATLSWISEEIKNIKDNFNIDIAIVIGGGNILRGSQASAQGMDRTTADYMGILATVINALAMQERLERLGVPTRVLSAIKMDQLCEFYIRRRAIRHLEKGRVVIFAGGIGNPYFSTDTTAVLRAIEIEADIIMKATKVDGIYDSDPLKNKNAKKFDHIRFIDVLKNGLKVMDSTAISLCMENKLPIKIFKLEKSGDIIKALTDKKAGSLITE